MNDLSRKFLPALLLVLPLLAQATDEYRLDDGVKEPGIGIQSPNSNSIAWLNHFTIKPGLTDISAVRVAFGGHLTDVNIPNGTPLTVYVWDDPNQDGDPDDAVVLSYVLGQLAGSGMNALNTFPVSVTLPVGHSFFAGVIVNYTGQVKVASLDEDGTDNIPPYLPSMQSWVAGSGNGAPVDPNAMNLAQVSLDRVSAMLGYDGTWMIRLNAVAPTAPALSISPNSLDLGQVAVGATVGPRTVTLTSTGTSGLDVGSIQAPLPPFSLQPGGTCPAVTPFPMNPGDSCTLAYAFRPPALGPLMETLLVTSNAATSPDKIVLQGEGIASDPVLSPTILAFGEADIDSSTSMTLSVFNPGNVPLTVNGSSISGPVPSAFTDMGGTCGPYPFALPSGATCDLVFEFKPPAHGPFTEQGQLLSNASAGSGMFDLDGTGVIFDDGFEP